MWFRQLIVVHSSIYVCIEEAISVLLLACPLARPPSLPPSLPFFLPSCLPSFLPLFLFETGSLYVFLASLGNHREICLLLSPIARVKCMYHHAQPLTYFYLCFLSYFKLPCANQLELTQ